MKKNRVILITGASSGIGRSLSLLYATPETTLLLTGRNAERLENVAAECRQKGALVETSTLAVTDRAAFEKKILDWDDAHTLDIVIANAGVSGGTSMDMARSETQLRDIMATNLDGTFNTVNPLIPRMTRRGSGHIVLMSSMAGFRGMPNAPAYSVSKVAVRAYGDALRPLLKKSGVTVSTVFPGFVKTPLTDVNTFPMPFLMEVDEAAAIIKHGLDVKKSAIAFPLPIYIFCWLLGVLPRPLGDLLLRAAPKKG